MVGPYHLPAWGCINAKAAYIRDDKVEFVANLSLRENLPVKLPI
jgi:hypothetical protein